VVAVRSAVRADVVRSRLNIVTVCDLQEPIWGGKATSEELISTVPSWCDSDAAAKGSRHTRGVPLCTRSWWDAVRDFKRSREDQKEVYSDN
jgi:hypothetical protein